MYLYVSIFSSNPDTNMTTKNLFPENGITWSSPSHSCGTLCYPTSRRNPFPIPKHFVTSFTGKHRQNPPNATWGFTITKKWSWIQLSVEHIEDRKLSSDTTPSTHWTEDTDPFAASRYSHGCSRSCCFIAVPVQMAVSVHSSMPIRISWSSPCSSTLSDRSGL